ncbi:MAG TPA: hypothetical protein VK548_16525 [Candidatus Acidoferrum sp.]|nr:hypothetical protein [Candidatus Acidoferrum sp.]
MRFSIVVLVACLLWMTVAPAAAQLGDPLSLAALGVLLPFFSDPAAGFVSVFELTSPVVPGTIGFAPPTDFTNPIHAVFFNATCTRTTSNSDVFTSKQTKAIISTVSPLSLTYNGLAAFATSPGGNDLIQTNFPFFSRTHWIDVKTGRLRELEPITVAAFLGLAPGFLPLVVNPGAGASIELGPPFVWNPLRSAVTFVTPQESASVRGSLYLICPRATIQSPTGGGVFSVPSFPRLVNRDGSFGFQPGHVITNNSVSRLRARVYDDNEALSRDYEIPCDCLTARSLLDIDGGYAGPPTNLGAGTVPVWYTEIESTAQSANPLLGGTAAAHNSFTGYWGLEVTGSSATLFHRLSSASLDNLSSGSFNPFSNR